MRLWWLIRWIEEAEERKIYKGLPRGCWHCEVLGLCRRPKEEGWKCYSGCMLINLYNIGKGFIRITLRKVFMFDITSK